MRTTIDLDPDVLAQLKQRQRAEGKNLGTVASELLARALADSATPDEPYELKLPVKRMGRPLVDLEDKEAVYAVIDADQVS